MDDRLLFGPEQRIYSSEPLPEHGRMRGRHQGVASGGGTDAPWDLLPPPAVTLLPNMLKNECALFPFDGSSVMIGKMRSGARRQKRKSYGNDKFVYDRKK